MIENRSNRLSEDLDCLRRLEAADRIVDLVEAIPLREYRLRLNVSGFSVLNDGSVAVKDSFKLAIKVPSGFPLQPLTVSVPAANTIPFTPHFTSPPITLWPSRWRDPRPHDQPECLVHVLERIGRCIALEPEFLDRHNTVNRYFWPWHDSEYQQHTHRLPAFGALSAGGPHDAAIKKFFVSGTTIPTSPNDAQSGLALPLAPARQDHPTGRKKFALLGEFERSEELLPESVGPDELLDQETPTPAAKTNKFRIKSESDHFSVHVCSVPPGPYWMVSDLAPTEDRPAGLFLAHSAMEKLLIHIGWGHRTRDNVVEQGGLLLGKVFRDARTGSQFTSISEIIEARAARGTSSYLEMSHSIWKCMMDRMDRLVAAGEVPADLVVAGWYHTHPNDLGIFMSGTDRGTQRALFRKDWQFAVVLNPHRKLWRAFAGAECFECPAAVYPVPGVIDNK